MLNLRMRSSLKTCWSLTIFCLSENVESWHSSFLILQTLQNRLWIKTWSHLTFLLTTFRTSNEIWIKSAWKYSYEQHWNFYLVETWVRNNKCFKLLRLLWKQRLHSIWIFLKLDQFANWTKILYANMLVDFRWRMFNFRQHCASKTEC